ncbi:MAG TPA: hypothetical protein VGR28_04710, partial [Candidatus Thermoplasmatota archaeon]|nr:hypothetical protein [Candidatus Thermoplasmatota archaeon]
SPELLALGPRVQPYFALAYFPAVFYLASVYPELRRWISKLAVPALPFLVGIAALEVAYASDHALYLRADGLGPLSLLLGLLAIAFPIAALLFAHDAAAGSAGNRRNSLLLLSMGFALIQAYDVLVNIFAGVQQQSGSGAQNLGVSAWPQLAIFGLLAAYLAWLATRSEDLVLRNGARKYLGALAVLLATALSVIAGPARGLAPSFETLWDFALPVLVGYALLRHQIFGIDLKLRFAVRQSTLAAAFVGLFFVVSEAAQQFFASEVGPALGIAAAGMLLFALAPLQAFAERVARATVPNAKPALQLEPGEKAVIFRDAARTAWADGILDKNERAMLEQLRVTLGLSREEAGHIEHEVAR